MIQRSDDTEAAIQARLNTFHKQTEPLLKFYKDKGKLLSVDGTPPIEDRTV